MPITSFLFSFESNLLMKINCSEMGWLRSDGGVMDSSKSTKVGKNKKVNNFLVSDGITFKLCSQFIDETNELF